MATGNKRGRKMIVLVIILALAFHPVPVLAEYTPAETNPLLGRPVLLDQLTCIQKYGQDFCACIELEQGGYGCYYKRPAAGMYTLERCEQIWGPGHCECPSPDQCMLKTSGDTATPLGCDGQIYVFPGTKEECRKPGVQTMGSNCCLDLVEASKACGFENLAKELGWSDAAIAMITSLGGYFAKKRLANWAAQYVINQAVTEGAFSFVTSGLGSLFGDGAIHLVNDSIAGVGVEFVSSSGSFTAYVGSEAGMQSAVSQLSAVYLNAISWVGWAYSIYSMYNIVDGMTKCLAGEKILGCKRSKGVCHDVGTTCTFKVFGMCGQKKRVFCCFDTVLARIIHEQGRPQIGLGWGDGDDPECRGFYMDEFMRIDFTQIDLGEYTDDLTRQMLNQEQVGSKISNLLEKYMSGIPQ